MSIEELGWSVTLPLDAGDIVHRGVLWSLTSPLDAGDSVHRGVGSGFVEIA